jgi:anti-sigma regulatory factor (Ser/Thr protein kinase)
MRGNGNLTTSTMTKIFDTATDCKLLYSGPTKNESALILLRSKLAAISHRIGIPDMKRENMLLVASELVHNNIKHAGGSGMIQVWMQPGPILDILALDYGPGIADLALAEKDGYSTSGTFGKGLGAIRRLSDESYIYTQPEHFGHPKRWSGTVFLARFILGTDKDFIPKKTGLFCRSLSDKRHNGDRIYWQKTGDRLRWLHLDGLGHGEEALEATANLATHLTHSDKLDTILEKVDRQLVNTRGAVGIICEVDLARHNIQLLGVGDMHAHIYDHEQLQPLAFAPGILGKDHRSTSPFQSSLGKRAIIVTASDGIRRNWDTENFVGLFSHHPQLIAYTLGNIMGRISDDQSICVSTIG